jgi:hypothetical protein
VGLDTRGVFGLGEDLEELVVRKEVKSRESGSLAL